MVSGNQSGGEKTGGAPANQDGRGQDSFMLSDGRQILNYRNPATIITVGFVSFVLLIGSTTLIGYRAGRNEVKQICIETVPGVKIDDDDPRSLRKRIYDLETKANTCSLYDGRLKVLECYLIKGKDCK